MKYFILLLVLFFLIILPVEAQEPIYLPVILSSGDGMTFSNAILRIGDGTDWIDLIGPNSGWKLADPKWRPRIAQFKGGGSMVNSAQAEGQGLVHTEYDNVIETIPLILDAGNPDQAIQTLRDASQMIKQASDYHSEVYEYNNVWIEAKPAGENFLLGYSEIIKGSIPEYDPWSQPFIGATYPNSVMENLTLILERKPFWQPVEPGTIIGPLYNLIKNPDFELWNFGVGDSQPDSWNDSESLWITGDNSRIDEGIKWGRYGLQINVDVSTVINAYKGITQVIEDTLNNTEYTVLAWVRNDGITNGVGRILVEYSSQLELYRSATAHGWQLYSGKITTDIDDIVSIHCHILSTAVNTDGSFYIDGLMFIQGDWVDEAQNDLLPYMSSSHIVNHQDIPGNTIVDPGDINYVDVWNIPGDVDSLIKLEFKNNTVPADESDPIEIYKKIRIGMRRTNDVFNFANYNDPTGINDITASGDSYSAIENPVDSYKIITTRLTEGFDLTRDNEGRFRLFARILDELASGNSNLNFRVRYFIGQAGITDKILNDVLPNIVDNWTIVDLTKRKSVIFDQKYSSIIADQFGYQIEAKRITGSTDGRFDYSMLMPTDGGFISVELGSPLKHNGVLTISNILGYVNVKGTDIKTGFQQVFEVSTGVISMVVFNDALFIGDPGGELYKYKNGIGEEVYNFAPGAPISMAVYNGKLHIASGNNVYASDGNTFPGNLEFSADNTIWTMITFDGYLWQGTLTDAELFRWDGTVNISIIDTGDATIRSLAVYNNDIFFGTSGNGRIYRYNLTTGITTESLNLGATITYSLEVFNNKLYAGTNNQRIYSFDGDIWEEKTDFTGNLQTVSDLLSLNNVLYAIGAVGANVPIYQTTDGEIWETIYDANEEEFANVLCAYQGNLFVGIDDVGISPVYAIFFEENIYNIPDYEGTGFLAPNRKFNNSKRHKYFFLYDRENFVNNISDKALIGVGFVPRYLTLLNKEEIPLGN
jgi:hypothetical protein